ncbi:hypothetical protein A0H81_06816 [Grifola frondosa]|uniref:Uncharacterized protein n=1 Tax=Grifola frondosa TaxID=5627 RepID=A0A1C7M791_GRIFR|nr:hypothetical protein A0H81_06816 [Grifola frondosa]
MARLLWVAIHPCSSYRSWEPQTTSSHLSDPTWTSGLDPGGAWCSIRDASYPQPRPLHGRPPHLPQPTTLTPRTLAISERDDFQLGSFVDIPSDVLIDYSNPSNCSTRMTPLPPLPSASPSSASPTGSCLSLLSTPPTSAPPSPQPQWVSECTGKSEDTSGGEFVIPPEYRRSERIARGASSRQAGARYSPYLSSPVSSSKKPKASSSSGSSRASTSSSPSAHASSSSPGPHPLPIRPQSSFNLDKSSIPRVAASRSFARPFSAPSAVPTFRFESKEPDSTTTSLTRQALLVSEREGLGSVLRPPPPLFRPPHSGVTILGQE